MDKIHLPQSYKEGLGDCGQPYNFISLLPPLPINCACCECTLACVVLKGLHDVTASSDLLLPPRPLTSQLQTALQTWRHYGKVLENYFFNCLLHLKTPGKLRKCKSLGREKNNMVLIFETRPDLAVPILVNLISVHGKMTKRKICRHLEGNKVRRRKQHKFINNITEFCDVVFLIQIMKLVEKYITCHKSGLFKSICCSFLEITGKNEFNLAEVVSTPKS